MDLGNLLKREGGVPLTGRKVRFHLVASDKERTLREVQVEAVLLPVSEESRLDALQEARTYCAEQKRPDDFYVESDLRVLVRALRDPDDLRKQFCLNADLHLLRQGLVQRVMSWLVKEYDKLLREQYPETLSKEEFAALEAESKDFSEGGQRD